MTGIAWQNSPDTGRYFSRYNMKSLDEVIDIDILKAASGKRLALFAVFVLCCCVLFFWFRNILLAAVLSVCTVVYISDAFYCYEKTMVNRLHRQLVGFLEYMIIMLRSGKTIRYIFHLSWSRFPRPLRSYLKEIAQRLEIDPDLGHALDIFEKRSGSREVSLINAGIKINSRTGGDLIILLESISETLRESLRARSRLENLTLQSRISANIISLFPIMALLFLHIFYSDSILNFFSTSAGTIFLLFGGILEVAGILFMKKITRE